MQLDKFNKTVDAWVAEQNKRKGEVTIPKRGAYPIDPANPYGMLMLEWVTTDVIRCFSQAIGDRNPLWWNEDYARSTIWGGIIAPPTFTDSISPGFAVRRVASPFEYDFPALPGGSSREWFQAIRPGDKFRIVDTWLGLEEKKSHEPQPYRLFTNTGRRRYINQKDETVAIVEGRLMVLAPQSDPSSGTSKFKGVGRKRHKFTDAERDAIYRGYDEETRQGDKILFWEDVAIGKELKPLVVGPVSAWDTAAFLAALPGHSTAFDVQWDKIKLDYKFAWLDPEINAWKCGGEGHLADGAGHAASYTGGYAFGFGAQMEGLVCRMICNWMGDAGFLKRFNFKNRAIPILGDLYKIKGKVTGKATENGEHLVNLAINLENQEGLVLGTATADVRLLTKSQF